MKVELRQFLRQDDNWKQFIKEKRNLDNLSLINLDIITMQREDGKLFFDLSITYEHGDGMQRLIYESGCIATSENRIIGFCDDVFLN